MIEPTRILLMRHGETDWNVEQRIQGQLDVPLNAHGRWQAERLARALAGEELAAIYSSDLERTGATAAPLAASHGLAIVTDAGLRERGFGRFEGLTYAEIEQRYPDEAERWRKRELGFGPGGGEAVEDFFARSVATLIRLAEPHAGQHIAVVAHGGVLDCLYRAAQRLALDAPRSWRMGNASINRLLYAEGGFSVVGWDDSGHLERGSALDDSATE